MVGLHCFATRISRRSRIDEIVLLECSKYRAVDHFVFPVEQRSWNMLTGNAENKLSVHKSRGMTSRDSQLIQTRSI